MFTKTVFHPASLALGLFLFAAFSQTGCTVLSNRTGTGLSGGFQTDGAAKIAQLADLLGRRLALAENVAFVKFRDGLPVEDRAREQDFLAVVEDQAVAAGVDPAGARVFFAAQIEASKLEQNHLLRGWKRGLPVPDWGSLSLRDDVRPELDRLTPRLLAAWQAVHQLPDLRRRLYRELRGQGWSIPVARAASSF